MQALITRVEKLISDTDTGAPTGTSPAGGVTPIAMDQLDQLQVIDRSSSDSLQVSVYAALESAIINARLPIGQRFFEKDVAARLGVSRTPVREAIRRLEAQGRVIFTEGRRGFEVANPLDDVAVVYDIRKRLEGLAASLAAQFITVPELEVLDAVQFRTLELLNGGEATQHVEELADLNARFHHGVNAASHRPRLIGLINQLSPIYISHQIVTLYNEEQLRHSLESHGGILSALWERNSDEAERLTEEHLDGGKQFILGISDPAIQPTC